MPRDSSGELVAFESWLDEIKEVQANGKATTIIQCGLTQAQREKIKSFRDVKELWEKLSKLHHSYGSVKFRGLKQ